MPVSRRSQQSPNLLPRRWHLKIFHMRVPLQRVEVGLPNIALFLCVGKGVDACCWRQRKDQHATASLYHEWYLRRHMSSWCLNLRPTPQRLNCAEIWTTLDGARVRWASDRRGGLGSRASAVLVQPLRKLFLNSFSATMAVGGAAVGGAASGGGAAQGGAPPIRPPRLRCRRTKTRRPQLRRSQRRLRRDRRPGPCSPPSRRRLHGII